MAVILAVSCSFQNLDWIYCSFTDLLFLYSGQTLGWTGLIRVDGTAYGWMGNPADVSFVNQTSYTYTSTSSIYVQSVEDKVQIKVTFLSPITPDDFLRQSLIFSYVDVEVVSLDGKEHDVQLYTDISAGKWDRFIFISNISAKLWFI